MNLFDLFSSCSNTFKQQAFIREGSAHWIKCPSCQSLMYYKEVENQNSCLS